MSTPQDQKTAFAMEKARVANANCLSFHELVDFTEGVAKPESAVPISPGLKQGEQLLRVLFGENSRFCISEPRISKKTGRVGGMLGSVYRFDQFDFFEPDGSLGVLFKVNEVRSLKPSGKNGGWTDGDCGFEYMMIELDHAGEEEQKLMWRALITLGFPVISLTSSGGKSLHGIIRLSASSLEDYLTRSSAVLRMLGPFIPDQTSKNPSRYTRLPGMLRKVKNKTQWLRYLNPSAPVWEHEGALSKRIAQLSEGLLPVPVAPKAAHSLPGLSHWSAPDTEKNKKEQKEFVKRLRSMGVEPAFDVMSLTADCGIVIDDTVENRIYIRCPWAEGHTGGGEEDGDRDAMLYSRDTGVWRWSFKCLHDSCADRDYSHVLEKLRDEFPESFEEIRAASDVLEVFQTLPDTPDEPPDTKTLLRSWLASKPSCDVSNAAILECLHGRDLRYVKSASKWYVWGAHRWREDATGRAHELAKDVYRKRVSVCDPGDSDSSGQMAEAGSVTNIKAMLAHISTTDGVAAEVSDFDSSPDLLGFRNGILDTRSGVFRDGRRSDMITLSVNCDYDPEADCPLWKEFMESIHPDDPDITEFLQTFMGYCLSGSTREHKMLILYGPKGRNGKGVFMETLRDVLGAGGYAYETPPGFLGAVTNENPNAASPSLAELKNRRLTMIDETRNELPLAEDLVKRLTGSSNITARGLHQGLSTFRLQSKFVVMTNHKPTVTGTDSAIWSRILLVMFKEHFYDGDPRLDKDLKEKLLPEAPGIINWLVTGLRRWLAEGLKIPQTILNATSSYRKEEDVVGMFIDACATLTAIKDGPGVHQSSSKPEVIRGYRTWCRENGFGALGAKRFNRALGDRGFTQLASQGVDYWRGLKLNDLSTFDQ